MENHLMEISPRTSSERETLRELEAALAAREDVVQQLKSALNARETEIEKLRTQLAQRIQMVASTQKERDQLRAQNAELVKKLAEISRIQSVTRTVGSPSYFK